MIEEELFEEIRNVLKQPMMNNDHLKFTILQPTGGGSKTLTIPATSSTFEWTASAVAGNSKSPIYILANEGLKIFFTSFIQAFLLCIVYVQS